ncbi:MAG TPA: serine/threonine-protein kinase [Polyangiaceae bacterium]|nr:serine/threonine-protein kinase [Polyangiaceae bacterium]
MVEQAARSKPSVRPKVIGRYALFGEIAAGGMATVHVARLVGPVGFSRTVAIKRLHPQYSKDPEFVGMFLDEARLASRVQHPNVVTTLDVVTMPNEVFLVMEYVAGESLARLVRNTRKEGAFVPPGIVAAVIAGMLNGLHAAHEAKSERREPLNIVHRDVSPQNVLVGSDGVARVLDFGVAKAALRSHSTRDGQMKGKLSYMSPEQLNGKPVDRRTDLFAAGVVLWEALTGKRLFEGSDAGEIFAKVVAADIPEPKSVLPEVPDTLNAVVMKALERSPDRRYQTAREFAIDLEASVPLATARAVGEWVERFGGPDLEKRTTLVQEIEGISTNPEDLARLEREPEGETSPPSVKPDLTSSAVQPVSGSRPRIPPPPIPPPPKLEKDLEERSSKSHVTGASTSKVASLAVPVPAAPASLPKPPPPRSNTAAMLIGALAACLGGGVLAFYLFGRGHEAPRVIEGGPSPAAQAPFPRATTESPGPGASPSAAAPAAESEEKGVDISDLPAAPPDEAPGASSGRRRAPHAAASAKPGLCDPPFFIDPNGIKRVKPGCF